MAAATRVARPESTVCGSYDLRTQSKRGGNPFSLPRGTVPTRENLLFEEWLRLLGDEPPVVDCSCESIGPDDALVVIDMQADFVPCDPTTNPHGGRFGVPEGDLIVPTICSLIAAATACSATIVATRDYHPYDHASFNTEGGPFPPHCVQGTAGAELLPPIALALSDAWRRRPDDVMIAFKAFHEDVDSFGAFPYETGGPGRVFIRNPALEARRRACPSGCHACPFTGCIVLKQSALHAAKARGVPPDMNAPPDLLAMTNNDGKERSRRSLREALADKKRLFVCGLALDFCVLDTCINGVAAGFAEVYLVLDCARAAHLAGIGQHGTGFLTAPREVLNKLQSHGVRLVTSHTCCGDKLLESDLWNSGPTGAQVSSESRLESRLAFPETLGPLGLELCHNLSLKLDTKEQAYTLDLAGALEMLAHTGFSFANTGRCSPVTPLPRGWPSAPKQACSLCWAYPLEGMRQLSEQPQTALAFLGLTVNPALRFTAYGGFVLLDDQGAAVALQTLGAPTGGALTFGRAEKLSRDTIEPLHSRMQDVTLPSLLRAGAEQFCWLVPGEALDYAPETQHETQSFRRKYGANHGAFAYRMNDGPPLLFCVNDPALSDAHADAAKKIQAHTRGHALRKTHAPTIALAEITMLRRRVAELETSLPSRQRRLRQALTWPLHLLMQLTFRTHSQKGELNSGRAFGKASPGAPPARTSGMRQRRADSPLVC